MDADWCKSAKKWMIRPKKNCFLFHYIEKIRIENGVFPAIRNKSQPFKSTERTRNNDVFTFRAKTS